MYFRVLVVSQLLISDMSDKYDKVQLRLGSEKVLRIYCLLPSLWIIDCTAVSFICCSKREGNGGKIFLWVLFREYFLRRDEGLAVC